MFTSCGFYLAILGDHNLNSLSSVGHSSTQCEIFQRNAIWPRFCMRDKFIDFCIFIVSITFEEILILSVVFPKVGNDAISNYAYAKWLCMVPLVQTGGECLVENRLLHRVNQKVVVPEPNATLSARFRFDVIRRDSTAQCLFKHRSSPTWCSKFPHVWYFSIKVEVQISFDDAVRGIDRQVRYRSRVSCDSCGGTVMCGMPCVPCPEFRRGSQHEICSLLIVFYSISWDIYLQMTCEFFHNIFASLHTVPDGFQFDFNF